jgi:hypothetical protein
MASLENVSIESIRADYLKKRITITLSVSILQMDSDVRAELVKFADLSKPISIDFDAMPDAQTQLGL